MDTPQNDYKCYCMECGEVIELAIGETPQEQEIWFQNDDELKLCDTCSEKEEGDDFLRNIVLDWLKTNLHEGLPPEGWREDHANLIEKIEDRLGDERSGYGNEICPKCGEKWTSSTRCDCPNEEEEETTYCGSVDWDNYHKWNNTDYYKASLVNKNKFDFSKSNKLRA